MSSSHRLEQRVSYDGALCTVRYIGEVIGTTGTWLGVEWDDTARGKHDGCHRGVRYFKCISKSPTAASFVRPTRPADSPRSFLQALNDKYVAQLEPKNGRGSIAEIVISGKRAEEVGFDKIRRQQSKVDELTIVILEDMQLATALAPGEDDTTIQKTCPKIVQLDLGRNLLQDFEPVVSICRQLPAVRSLGISGNRFQAVLDDQSLQGAEDVFKGVKLLSLDETLLSWEEICHIASKYPALTTLEARTNQIRSLSDTAQKGPAKSLMTLTLEVNEFTTLSDLGNLTAFTKLRHLHLKGNNITTIAPEGQEAPIFPDSIQYLDVSYNNIQSWSFVDQLLKHFPGLTGLRINHNPFYDAANPGESAASSEESHMLTVARIASLNTLNFSHITVADRTNAEMFYLSRIGKQLAAVSEAAEAGVLEIHPRYEELCEIYGAPNVIRRTEVNPAFLEARLVNVGFHYKDYDAKSKRIPKSFDIYRVKGIAGKLFDISPLKLGLVWETGEWDPVAGFDDHEGDSSDEEEAEEERERQGVGLDVVDDGSSKPGRWIKREVELKDGPRQLGYCVDGMDVTIRVEAR